MTRQDDTNAGFRSTIHAAGRLLDSWKRRRQARRTVSTLHGLSDYQLKDIGLRRSEIDHRFHY